MKIVHLVALALVVIGAINWGLVGAAQFNLVDAIFGAGSAMSRAVYVIVGLAGLVLIATTVMMHQPARRSSPSLA